MKVFPLIAALLLLLSPAAGHAETVQPLVRAPALGASEIVFVHGGFLWSVPRAGGDARQLTTGGHERAAFFSPDGAWIAFAGTYDGNEDVYVMPAAGGEKRRLTWHPGADIPVGWTPDGKNVLFSSARESYGTFTRIYTVSPEGGPQQPLPMWRGHEGSLSPDGARIAYVPNRQWQKEWKRYRGGQTTPVWLLRLKDLQVEKIPRANSNDSSPVWVGDKVYFLSDRNGPVTLFAYDTKTKAVKPLIANRGLDLKTLSGGPGGLVYEQFGRIHLFDPVTAKSVAVEIRLPSDLPETRPHPEKAAEFAGNNVALSPNGDAAVFEARGEIFRVATATGEARNLTGTPGIAERSPAISPDGSRIAYLSDESGEYALHVRDAGGEGTVQKIDLGLPPSFFEGTLWSPDSKRIVLTDKRMNLWCIDVATGRMTKVDTNLFQAPGAEMQPVWSPDGTALAYTKFQQNYLHAVHVWLPESDRHVQITDRLVDARHPAFDKAGRVLLFAVSTDVGGSLSFQDLSGMQNPVTRKIHAFLLQKDSSWSLAAGTEGLQSGGTIDLDRPGERIVELPLKAAGYIGIDAATDGVFFLHELPLAPPLQALRGAATVTRFDLATRKAEPFAAGVTNFRVSADGGRALYRAGRDWFATTTEAGAKPAGALDLAGMQITAEPRAEWAQMYREVWRLIRDYFYDPALHGADLTALEQRYRLYLAGVGGRDDLTYLFAEMLSNLTIGHMFFADDLKFGVQRSSAGLLGADYRIENGRYRFARIFKGAAGDPVAAPPLARPGLNVREGDYLLEVNGQNVDAGSDVHRFFDGTAGKPTRIKVAGSAGGQDARELTVVPVNNEYPTRVLDWAEQNRRTVERLSNGRIAYVHLPDTKDQAFASFNRFYFGQTDRSAAIVDARYNSGGRFADYIVDALRRPLRNCASTREGRDWCMPQAQIYGPKTMITNEMSGSGGDALPWMFQQDRTGVLVGARTWGGLVGGGGPSLLDGSGIGTPFHGHFGLDGRWAVENYGVTPDVEIENDPASVAAGHDPQLEKAVEVTLAALRRNPVRLPVHAAYPSYR